VRTLAVAAAVVLLAGTPAPAATIEVTSAEDGGAGTLRDAIERANEAPGSTITIPHGRDLVIVVNSALPQIRADGTTVRGGGATLREGEACERPGHKKGCSGLVVAASDVTIRDLHVAGFLFDGISVHGEDASDVRIEDVQAIGNRDDGIGISDGAGPVTVEHCLLMGNGFRTKGKGVLVFSDAKAVVRDSVAIGNRDGVTVTRGSNATLENVVIAASYDKGLGASAASIQGDDLAILANGRDPENPAPNADGVRVGLGGRIDLRRSLVAGNGDNGVVVLDTSTITLDHCRLESNHGGATSVAPAAHLEQR